MKALKSRWLVLFAGLGCWLLPLSAFAQRGIPTPEESFERLDRNRNSQVDPEEWESLPGFFRGMYEKQGVKLSETLSRDDYLKVSRALREGLPGRGGSSEKSASDRNDGDSNRSSTDRNDDSDDNDEDEQDEDEKNSTSTPGSSAGAPASSSSTPASTTSGTTSLSANRPSVSQKLPETYRSRDKDGDGQIGFYEWTRSDYANFRKLDRNGDGFLTPRELNASSRSLPGSLVSRSGFRSSSTATAPTSVSTSVAGSSTLNAVPSSTSPPGSTSPSTGGGSSARAELAFRLLDKDKDASITAEEWARSLSSRSVFEKAGITVTFPMSKADFLRLYPK